MKRPAWLSTALQIYVIFVAPLLIAVPVLQAIKRWRTWEIIAWAALCILAVYAYLQDKRKPNDET